MPLDTERFPGSLVPGLASLVRPFASAAVGLLGCRTPAPPPLTYLRHRTGAGTSPPIPRIVWSYWHSPQRPWFVEACLRSWGAASPGYAVRVLDAGSARDWVPAPEFPVGYQALPEFRKADWLRLALLRRHGGIWLDAATILPRSLDWLLEAQEGGAAECVGFYLGKYTRREDRPVLENWCIAAPPGSDFVEEWYRELTDEVIRRGDAGYLAWLRATGVFEDALQGIDMPEYLTMHLAAQRVLARGAGHRLHLFKAEETALLYQARADWLGGRFCRSLLMRRAAAELAPMIKLRSNDRKKLERWLKRGQWLRGSVAERFLVSGAAAG